MTGLGVVSHHQGPQGAAALPLRIFTGNRTPPSSQQVGFFNTTTTDVLEGTQPAEEKEEGKHGTGNDTNKAECTEKE